MLLRTLAARSPLWTNSVSSSNFGQIDGPSVRVLVETNNQGKSILDVYTGEL